MDMTSRKRSLSDMKYSRLPSKHIDEEVYRAEVLGLPANVTEGDLDEKLAQEAHDLGLNLTHPPADIDGMTSSSSTTTLASDPNNKGSIISQSTAPTSCSSSERRPVNEPSIPAEQSPTQLNAPSVFSDKKRDSSFRNGFRKMTGFRKRRLGVITSSTNTSINSEIANSANADSISIKSELRSSASFKSSKSYWSNTPSATKSSYEQPVPVDNEAMKRSLDCKEMLNLHARQLDEKMRFLQYQQAVLTSLRNQHQSEKEQKIEIHRRVVAEASEKIDRATEEFESRQLEEEMKMVKEFEVEKRSIMVRLRHMEAYCQNPTPPPTPVDQASGSPSLNQTMPERKVTDKDYHNLAQQYRERDAMDSLHASKINVLRGKQKKAVENFVLKKEREIEMMENKHSKEIDDLEKEAQRDEDSLSQVFGSKRARLEMRWRLQAQVERSNIEKITGLSYASLPDVVAIEEQNSASMAE